MKSQVAENRMNDKQHKTTQSDERRAVEAWVSRRDRIYVYLLDFLDNGGRLIRCTEEGLALLDEAHGVCYAAGEDADCEEVRQAPLVMTDSRALAEKLVVHASIPEIMETTTAVYWGSEPVRLEKPGITTRPLTEEDLPFVLENYHNPGAVEGHIRDRIACGMIGGLLDGRLAGFAGIHQEGTMGLLEVLPAFRRRGLAEVLEAEVINLQLRRGRLPYCHVRVGNEASLALQRKMGLTLDHHLMYWVG